MNAWQIKGLKSRQYQIIFWLLDAGGVGKMLKRGWQAQCSADLGIHRLTLRANLNKMVRMGIMKKGTVRGEILLPASIFDCHVDRSKVQAKEILTKGESPCR